MIVAILGAGSWGTALATVVQSADEIRLWSRDAEVVQSISNGRENRRYLPGVLLGAPISATTDLACAIADSDAVVFAVPSSGMATTAAAAAAFITDSTVLITAAKGLDQETGARMSEVIRTTLMERHRCSLPIAALSGPNLAPEVARHLPTATVAASPSEVAIDMCRRLWMGPSLRVYGSQDITGVELAGAMKNVVAIGAGICEGMGYGDNSRAALMTRGLAEITRLGVAFGADPLTFLGLAGVGDLIATCGSHLSRNYRVGMGLGQGRSLYEIIAELDQVAEGVPTTKAICGLAERAGIEMPVSRSIYAILFEGAPVDRTLDALMTRPPRNEAS